MQTALVLHLEADTHQSLTALAIKTLGIVAVEPLAVTTATAGTLTPPAAPPVAPALPAAEAATLPAAAPRTRKPRAAAAPDAPILPAAAPAAASTAAAVQPAPQGPGNDAPAAASSPAKVPTVDEVRYALSEVNGTFGMSVCTSMLKEVGVDRVSLVPEAKRAEFIKFCNDKVAAEKKARLAAAGATA